MDPLTASIDRLHSLADKLLEVTMWIERARRELTGAPADDERRAVLRSVEASLVGLERQIEAHQAHQDVILGAILDNEAIRSWEDVDGRICTTLLPGDLLRVWRVARLMQGELRTPAATPPQFGQKIALKEEAKSSNKKGVKRGGGLLETEEVADGLQRS